MIPPELDSYAGLISSFSERVDEDKEDRLKRRIEIYFTDHSRLIANEITYFRTDYLRYGYQWLTANNDLIIRWDNAAHHEHILTHPHHQHVGSDDNVQPSEPMTLANVLAFITGQIAEN